MKQFLLGLAMLTAAHMWGQTPDMYCGPGTVWDDANQLCVVALPSDANFDGCVQLADLLGLLGAYGNCGIVEGCTNELACNFLAEANEDDGSCILVGSSCDDGDATTTGDQIQADCTCAGEPALQVGDYHEGGYIIYLNPEGQAFGPNGPYWGASGQHGIILKPYPACGPGGSCSVPSWGCVAPHWTSTQYGYAEVNTNNVISLCGTGNAPAIEQVANLSAEGYTDWFLPTTNELQLIHTLYHSGVLPSFAVSDFYVYWSSSYCGESSVQSGLFRAYEKDFGESWSGANCNNVNAGYRNVLAIRYF